MDILGELRRDCASLAGKFLAFSKRPELDDDQRRFVQEAFESLRFIHLHHFSLLRMIYGDPRWAKLDSVDIPDESPVSKARLDQDLADLLAEARGLHQKMLSLPGSNGCESSQQNNAIEYLMMGMDFWRNVELALMRKQFE